MKKLILLSLLTIAFTTVFSQLNYKVGLLTSLYTNDNNSHPKIALGSALAEVCYPVSGMLTLTATSGIVRYVNDAEGYNQFPVYLGTKRKINEYFYLGGNAGASFFSRIKHGVNFSWSAYAGMEVQNISIDIRYLNTVKPNSGLSTTAVVLSYNF